MTGRAHNGRRSVSQPVATSGECSWYCMWMCLARVEKRISNDASPSHSCPSRRTRTRKVEIRSASACGVDRLAQPQHLRQYKQHDLDCLPGRKRGNDAGRAKANQPPPFNAATTIILQTPSPSKPAKFLFVIYLCYIVPSSCLPLPPPSAFPNGSGISSVVARQSACG